MEITIQANYDAADLTFSSVATVEAVERLNHMQESISEAKAAAEELKQLLEDIKFVTVSVSKEDSRKDNSRKDNS